MKRIKNLSESPCIHCDCRIKCTVKIDKNPKLQEIQDAVFGNADFDYHDCGIWIALNAPEMVEVDKW